MSASGRSSDASKKLLILLLSLLAITIIFVAVVALRLATGGSTADGQDNTILPSNSSAVATGLGTGPGNSTIVGGITRTSLLSSLALLRSANDSAVWLSANPDWRLFMVQADYMDGQGLARHWSLILRSANGSLVAYVDNGKAVLVSAEDNIQSDPRPQAAQVLIDSSVLLCNVTSSLGIDVDTGLTPFEFLFNDDNEDGIYRLSYYNPADEGKSFVASFDARTGEAIES